MTGNQFDPPSELARLTSLSDWNDSRSGNSTDSPLYTAVLTKCIFMTPHKIIAGSTYTHPTNRSGYTEPPLHTGKNSGKVIDSVICK